MAPRVQPPRKVDLELSLTTLDSLLEQDLRAAQRSVRENIEDYFARLPVREAVASTASWGWCLAFRAWKT